MLGLRDRKRVRAAASRRPASWARRTTSRASTAAACARSSASSAARWTRRGCSRSASTTPTRRSQRLQNRIEYRLQDDGYIQDKLISGRRFRVDPATTLQGHELPRPGHGRVAAEVRGDQAAQGRRPDGRARPRRDRGARPEDEAQEVAKLIEKRIRKKRRDYWRDRVMDLGPLINEAEREQRGLIEFAAFDPGYAPAIDRANAHLAYLERRRDGYLDKLRSTA
jgi:hypothetical protein